MALICDTGALFAALDRDDPDHDRCAALLAKAREPLVVPGPVLVELEWLLTARISSAAFDPVLADIEERRVRVADLVLDDYVRIRRLSEQYRDLPLGFVDSSVVSVAERMKEPRIATLDHRHFRTVRPAHATHFVLLPE